MEERTDFQNTCRFLKQESKSQRFLCPIIFYLSIGVTVFVKPDVVIVSYGCKDTKSFSNQTFFLCKVMVEVVPKDASAYLHDHWA